MSLEQRLTDALHYLDRYQPSPDLFDRTGRSIEEDRAYRRRMRIGVSLSAVSALALAVLFGSVIARNDLDQLVVPKWSIVSAQFVLSVVLLFSLAPMIRRYGRPFLESAFSMSSETGERFSRVLDLAYYLSFGGLIVVSTSITDPFSSMVFPAELKSALIELGRFLLLMGLAHALNLIAIPVVGLISGSTLRRSLRRAAGDDAPDESKAARTADRVATWIVYAVAALVVLPVVVVAVAVIAGVLGS
jgi:hypothetical protein